MLSRGVVIGMVVLGVFPRYWVPKEYTKLLGLHMDWVEEQLEGSGVSELFSRALFSWPMVLFH